MLHVQKHELIHMQKKRLTKFMVQLAEVILTVLLAQVWKYAKSFMGNTASSVEEST